MLIFLVLSIDTNSGGGGIYSVANNFSAGVHWIIVKLDNPASELTISLSSKTALLCSQINN